MTLTNLHHFVKDEVNKFGELHLNKEKTKVLLSYLSTLEEFEDVMTKQFRVLQSLLRPLLNGKKDMS